MPCFNSNNITPNKPLHDPLFKNKYRIPSARLQNWDYRWAQHISLPSVPRTAFNISAKY